jgi:hypothetical protein
MIVFHIGATTSAIDAATGEYVQIDGGDFRALRRFVSLEAWYAATIRTMPGNRYDLR